MKKTLTNKSNIKRKRTHGFRKKMRSKDGRNVIKRRRQKGRHSLTVWIKPMPELKDWLSLKILAASPTVKRRLPLLLISVPKKTVSLATKRNRIKRLIREAFRQESGFYPDKDYFFRVTQNPSGVGLKEVKEAIGRAAIKCVQEWEVWKKK